MGSDWSGLGELGGLGELTVEVGDDLNGEGGPTEEVFDVKEADWSRGLGEGAGEGRVIEGRGSGEDFDLLAPPSGEEIDATGEPGRREEEERWGEGEEEDLSNQLFEFFQLWSTPPEQPVVQGTETGSHWGAGEVRLCWRVCIICRCIYARSL